MILPQMGHTQPTESGDKESAPRELTPPCSGGCGFASPSVYRNLVERINAFTTLRNQKKLRNTLLYREAFIKSITYL